MSQRWCRKCNYCWQSSEAHPSDPGTCPDGSEHAFGPHNDEVPRQPEVRGPGDALSADEETVLLAAAQGASMAPIGRWEGPVASLHRRGLLQRLDQFNYVVTPRGKAIADGKDDEFARGLIGAHNAAVLARGMVALTPVETTTLPTSGLWIGRSTDEVDDPTVPVPLPPPTMGCVCPPTSEQTCMNPLCPRKPYPTAR